MIFFISAVIKQSSESERIRIIRIIEAVLKPFNPDLMGIQKIFRVEVL